MNSIEETVIGTRFNRWTILGGPFRDQRKTFVMAECQCGRRLPVELVKLTAGSSKSCGCLRRETSALLSQFDEQGRSKYAWLREHGAWRTMRFKTVCPNARGYLANGAQGIRVCPEWGEFAQFAHDMGKRPHGFNLIRLDKTKDFEPGNCAWSASKHGLMLVGA